MRIRDVQTLIDWIGERNRPVSKTTAVQRASTCVRCPKNEPLNWKDIIKRGIASIVASQMALRHRMRLVTPLDSKLGTCLPCRCILNLKIWCPISHIEANLRPETQNALWDQCWILREMNHGKTNLSDHPAGGIHESGSGPKHRGDDEEVRPVP